jgi:hypothetical protein
MMSGHAIENFNLTFTNILLDQRQFIFLCFRTLVTVIVGLETVIAMLQAL